MDDITMEKRLELVQQVRSQYHQNQYDLSNRERILYGRTSRKSSAERDAASPDMALSDSKTPEGAGTSGSLRLRAVLAGALVLAVILADRFGLRPAGMEMNQIFQLLSEDYQENVEEFVETLTDSPIPQ